MPLVYVRRGPYRQQRLITFMALLQSEWVILRHFRLSGSMQVRLFGQGFFLSCKPSLLRWRTFTVVFKLYPNPGAPLLRPAQPKVWEVSRYGQSLRENHATFFYNAKLSKPLSRATFRTIRLYFYPLDREKIHFY